MSGGSRRITPSTAAIARWIAQGHPRPIGNAGIIRERRHPLILARRHLEIYREVLGWLEELTGNRIEVIHIVGGGSRNGTLNQFTADACQRPVVTGPVEATGLGNLLVQVRSSGELSSLAEMREVIRKSSDVATCQPGKSAAWDDAAARFAKLRVQAF